MAPLRLLTLMLSLAAFGASATAQDLLVIGNPSSTVNDLSRRELVDLYMGRTQQFPDGSRVIRIDREPSSVERKAFYQKLVGKSVAEINAYWARLVFAGRATPPMVEPNDRSVIERVLRNPNAIGYISAHSVNDKVRVLARVE